MQSLDEICSSLINNIRMHREIRSSYNKEIAFDFNPIDLFKINENQISSIIAYFLNPEENHGQGDLFLKIFLEKWNFFSSETFDLSKIDVKIEYSTYNKRRMDIFIKSCKKCIIIENKMGASDQNEQLKDYISFAEKEKLDWRCIYLTPTGSTPSEESLPQEHRMEYSDPKNKRLWLLSHKADMLSLFDDFSSACKADNVRMFIKAIIKYYEYRFQNNLSTQERNMMKEELKKNMELFEIAEQIASAKIEIKSELTHVIVRSCLKTFLGDSLGEKYYSQWKQPNQRWQTIAFNEEYLDFYLPGSKETLFVSRFEYAVNENKLYCGIRYEKGIKNDIQKQYFEQLKEIHDFMDAKYQLREDKAWVLLIDLIDGSINSNIYYKKFLQGEVNTEEYGKDIGKKMKFFFDDLRTEWDKRLNIIGKGKIK